MQEQELKQRLNDWAAQYGGDQFRRLGFSATLAPRSPEAQERSAIGWVTPADEIEEIVQQMEFAGRWRESRVLRAEHFMCGIPECEKLGRLSRIGLTMGRSAYYSFLASARAFVLGAITIRKVDLTDVSSKVGQGFAARGGEFGRPDT